MKLKVDCDTYGMPLMVEPLCMKMQSVPTAFAFWSLVVQPLLLWCPLLRLLTMHDLSQGKYGVNGSLKDILPLIRQAVELGADVIKCDPTDDPKDFGQGIDLFASFVHWCLC